MQVQCQNCGDSFDAKNPRAKWCSDRCRKRRERSGAPAAVVELRPPLVQSDNPDSDFGPVVAATWKKLEDADRLHEPEGVAALALAHRLDHGGRDTGSALASVARELRATLEVALKGAGVAADPIDQLRARREAKRAGNG